MTAAPQPDRPEPSVFFLIPPLTQLNTPYPSTAYLTGFLRARGYRAHQADLGIEMVLALLSRDGLAAAFDRARALPALAGEASQMLALDRAYLSTIDPVVAFLQGKDPSLAPLINQGRFLPQGPRFAAAQHPAIRQAAPTQDLARHLATLYLEDLADFVQATVAPQFALSRYAEHVGRSASSFDSIAQALAAPPSLTDFYLLSAAWRHLEASRPDVVGLTVPFPGNLYGALRVAQMIKARRPDIVTVLGGGYVNTELRRLREPRLFDLIDYVTLDDGERPLLCLLEHLAGGREEGALCRTFHRRDGVVVWRDGAGESDVPMADTGTPTYDGLALDRYLSVLDTLNPMHRLWSDGHWNKLTVAHGCYWKRCTFCDVGLDYIGRYEPAPSDLLVDRIEALIAETGRRGFHFVDEAAPPAGLKALALTLLERDLTISWWGNIRFEEAFSQDLCRLLAASGCVAVTAGLEAASDRLLAEMKKGVTVAQTARVASAFRQAGVLVHAYLMYAMPGETTAETVDALERVRQLFKAGLIQSAFWHRFMATAHSPIGLDPAAHGIRITGPRFEGFAENDLTYEDAAGATPPWIGAGLRAALAAYMAGEGLTADVRIWFARPVPAPTVSRSWLARALAGTTADDPAAERRFVWIGGTPVSETSAGGRRRVILPARTHDREVRLDAKQATWLLDLLQVATPTERTRRQGYPHVADVRAGYPLGPKAFDRLRRSMSWQAVREAGLLLV